jgi:hypothetical protein
MASLAQPNDVLSVELLCGVDRYLDLVVYFASCLSTSLSFTVGTEWIAREVGCSERGPSLVVATLVAVGALLIVGCSFLGVLLASWLSGELVASCGAALVEWALAHGAGGSGSQ